jgi:hypothetical protein
LVSVAGVDSGTIRELPEIAWAGCNKNIPAITKSTDSKVGFISVCFNQFPQSYLFL